jgi:hypothetical protein
VIVVDKMALVIPEKFQHIHRIMNTNIDGNRKVPYALTAIKGRLCVAYFFSCNNYLHRHGPTLRVRRLSQGRH